MSFRTGILEKYLFRGSNRPESAVCLGTPATARQALAPDLSLLMRMFAQ
jgi:hypothetical protein